MDESTAGAKSDQRLSAHGNLVLTFIDNNKVLIVLI